jgi:hypothetical protein
MASEWPIMSFYNQDRFCHSERSEESHAMGYEILRCAQNDKDELRMTLEG